MSNKADLDALDQLIVACEKTMTRPFMKSDQVPQVQETPPVETIDDKISQDDKDLAAFYESLDSESE